ncbi:ABC-2 type transport system ATP-binding protein [Caldicoprobacter guelmensis]|uniref:ABC transporter ATP-binding protein n=1 Tax=Caldicoprobacter guelmensis TaxID=1170224 RepID=UPI001959EAC5|nr:ABC transporter ATP-binding protein [Caldicoprobacter guelmensis]MBM7582039.1 ABC-2 type transport system ATP-binding protein [Caldicoprobacter guelmensis]
MDALSDVILNVSNLKKNYGKFEALKGVSFEVKKGEIFALIGPNGAGKTTTLRIIATLLTPTDGKVEFMGFDLKKNPDKIRQGITYLPEEAGAYKNLTGLDYLKFMASFYAEKPQDVDMYIERAIKIVGFKDRLKDKVGTYSKGMTRKLLLARALMTKPKLAILDEPTSGLDVINSLEIREVIKEFVKEGISVLLSSHNMLEIDFLSDRVAIIDKGQILETGEPRVLKDKYSAENLEEVFRRLVQ